MTPETSNNTDKPREHAGSKKPVTEEYILHNSIHMKFGTGAERMMERSMKSSAIAARLHRTELTVTRMLTAGKTLPTIPHMVDPNVYKLHFSKADVDSVPPKNGHLSRKTTGQQLLKPETCIILNHRLSL